MLQLEEAKLWTNGNIEQHSMMDVWSKFETLKQFFLKLQTNFFYFQWWKKSGKLVATYTENSLLMISIYYQANSLSEIYSKLKPASVHTIANL